VADDQLAFVFVLSWPPGGGGRNGRRHGHLRRAHPASRTDLRLTYTVELHRLRARVVVTNRGRSEVPLELSWSFAADYADLLEAHDGRRQQDAPVESVVEAERIRLRYAHEKLPFQTIVRGKGPGRHTLGQDRWTAAVHLRPREAATLELTVEAHDPDLPLDDAGRGERTTLHDGWKASLARVTVPGNALVEAALGRARDDLAAFAAGRRADEWLALQAGIPSPRVLRPGCAHRRLAGGAPGCRGMLDAADGRAGCRARTTSERRGAGAAAVPVPVGAERPEPPLAYYADSPARSCT
jgi:hypothetical protein